MIETTKSPAPAMSRGEVIGLCISGAGLVIAGAGLRQNIQARKDAAKAAEEQKKLTEAAVQKAADAILANVQARSGKKGDKAEA